MFYIKNLPKGLIELDFDFDTDIEKLSGRDFSQYSQFSIINVNVKFIFTHEVKEWIDTNCLGEISIVDSKIVTFDSEKDIILFKMRWM